MQSKKIYLIFLTVLQQDTKEHRIVNLSSLLDRFVKIYIDLYI
jgi:hypothetical protein